MKTFKYYQAQECYWTIIYNCSIPICIFLLYLYIKGIIINRKKLR